MLTKLISILSQASLAFAATTSINMFNSKYSITVHTAYFIYYTTLYCILYCTTLNYTTAQYTTHYTTLHYTLHCTILHYTTPHYTHYTTLSYTALHYISYRVTGLYRLGKTCYLHSILYSNSIIAQFAVQS